MRESGKMFIVPLTDDLVVAGGISYRVLSFNNYAKNGPAVLAEPLGGGAVETIPFSNIEKIEGQKAKLITSSKASKVFKVDGKVHRKFHLPQPGEEIQSGDQTFVVVKLRLHVREQLSRGLIIDAAETFSNDVSELVLGNIDKLGGSLFSRTKFLRYYADYKEKGTK